MYYDLIFPPSPEIFSVFALFLLLFCCCCVVVVLGTGDGGVLLSLGHVLHCVVHLNQLHLTYVLHMSGYSCMHVCIITSSVCIICMS